MSEPKLKNEPRVINVILFVGWMTMFYLIDTFVLGLNDEKWLQNWTIGLIGMFVFIAFYCVKEIRFFVFKSTKFNVFFISWFACWLLGDINDFFNAITVIFNLIVK